MSNITKVKINKDFKWDKISVTASDAANKKYMAESSIVKSQWGTNNGEIELEKRGDGTYLIWDDGVAMGFTDEESAQKIINAKKENPSKPTETQAKPTESPKINLDETQRKSNPNPPTQISTLGDSLSERLEKVSPLTGTESSLESDLTRSLDEYVINSEVEGIENVKQKLADDEAKRKQAEIEAARIRKISELKKKYPDIAKDGYEPTEELMVDGTYIVGTTKEGNNAKIYLFNSDKSLKGSVELYNYSNISNLKYNEKTKSIEITSNDKTIEYNLSYINNSVDKHIKYILTDNQKYNNEDFANGVSISSNAQITSFEGFASTLEGTKFDNLDGFNNYIKNNVIKHGYGTVDGVIAAVMAFAKDYPEETGFKYPYTKNYDITMRNDTKHEGVEPSNTYLDCRAFTQWAVYNGGFKANELNHIGESSDGVAAIAPVKTDVTTVQPGDIFSTPEEGHTWLVIGVDDDGYYAAEEFGSESGLVINRYSFDNAYGNYPNANLYDMSGYYNNPENVR